MNHPAADTMPCPTRSSSASIMGHHAASAPRHGAPIAVGQIEASVRAQAVQNLAVQAIKIKEDVIASAINAAIGAGWTLASLAGRLALKVYPDNVEVLSLDGNDILELRPMRFEQVSEDGSIKIKSVQDYRLLRSNAALGGCVKAGPNMRIWV